MYSVVSLLFWGELATVKQKFAAHQVCAKQKITQSGTELVIAHKFVSFQSGCDLIGRTLRTVWYFLGAQHLTNAAEINWLRAIMIQSDNVFDRSAQVRLMAGRKKHSG